MSVRKCFVTWRNPPQEQPITALLNCLPPIKITAQPKLAFAFSHTKRTDNILCCLLFSRARTSANLLYLL